MWHWWYHSSLFCSSFKTLSAEAASQLAASSRQPPSENSTQVRVLPRWGFKFQHTKSAIACSMNGFVVIKCSLIVYYWLLKKSENIGISVRKMIIQSPVLNSFLFIWDRISQLKMEIRYIAVKNALTARCLHAVTSQDSSKVSVKVSM